MSVSNLTAKLTLMPFGQGGVGRARGLLYGAVSIPGDASGGFAALAFSIPAGHAFVPILSSVRVAGASAAVFRVQYTLTPSVTDPATGQLVTVYMQGPTDYDGTNIFNIKTDGTILDAFQTLQWPRVVWRPEPGELAGSVRVNFIPNTNGATFYHRFLALAFDPEDVRQGFIPPFLDQLAISPPLGASP